jgi:Xaa-Pro aminopeptidase
MKKPTTTNSGLLIQEKITQAIDILREYDIDCWLTFTRESEILGDPVLPFLVPVSLTWHSGLIITSDGDTHAIVGAYDKKMVEDTGAYKEVVGYVEGMKNHLLEYLRKKNPKTIAINFSQESETCDGLTHGMYLTLVGYLDEIGYTERLISAEKIVSALRQRKTSLELEYIQEAIWQTERIFKGVMHFIAPNRTEEEIAQYMRNEVESAQLEYSWDQKICPAVFSGPSTAGAHYNPTQRKVEPGHVLNIDFGVKVNGYCSDLQRTFYILKPGETSPPPEVLKGFTTIVETIEQARLAMRPGVQGVEIDRIAREYLTSHGYKEFPHALGHQVGRYAHDGTALLGPPWEKYGRRPFHALETGMVFTIEPRLTVDGHGVATVENMVVVTETGAEFISTPQTKLILIGKQKGTPV